MMVFLRKGKRTYSAKVPRRVGDALLWLERSCGTKDPRTAKDVDAMLYKLGPAKARAWDVLDRITAPDPTLTLARLLDLWRETKEDLTLIRARLDDVDLEPLVAKWAKHLASPARDLADDTQQHYLAAVRLLMPKGRACLRSTMTPGRCETWISDMECQPGTVRKRAAGARDFFEWTVKRGTMAGSPMRDVALPAPGKPRDKWLTTEQVVLLADAKREPYRRLDYVLASTAADLSSAVDRLTRGDIDLSTMRARVRGTKTKERDRFVKIATFAQDEVRALCAGKLPHARLFADIPHRWAAADYHAEVRDALVGQYPWLDGYWLKDHRHTWAVRMAQAGAPMQVIAEGLGNTLEMVVRVYSRYAPSSAELEKWERVAAAQDKARAKVGGRQGPPESPHEL